MVQFRSEQWFNINRNKWFSMYRNNQSPHCCDLLSNCIFDLLTNTDLVKRIRLMEVVICFQIVSLTY